jgi:ketosteroid isomerase-like protein
MPSPNLDLVRSIFANWERGDFSSVDWAHADMEFVGVDGPEAGSWQGLANIGEGWSTFLGTWVEYHAEADEYRELDDERVLVLMRGHGLGKTSGLKVAHTGANVFSIREGKVTSLVIYWDRRRALVDLDLPVDSD